LTQKVTVARKVKYYSMNIQKKMLVLIGKHINVLFKLTTIVC